jgi:hypothetical protein
MTGIKRQAVRLENLPYGYPTARSYDLAILENRFDKRMINADSQPG